MTEAQISDLVIRACKLGAKGMMVIGWEPPMSATDNPQGRLVLVPAPKIGGASETPWYDK